MKSALPWPVSSQQDLPKCFSMAAMAFWKATALVFSKDASLPWAVFVGIKAPILFMSSLKKSAAKKKKKRKKNKSTLNSEPSPASLVAPTTYLSLHHREHLPATKTVDQEFVL